MSRFTVAWHQYALDELARFWIAASDPNTITHASNLIDKQLALDPVQVGQEVSPSLFKWSVPPLQVGIRWVLATG